MRALLLLCVLARATRHAIVVSGHLRSANDTIANIRTFVWAHNAHPVDVFYHLWINASDACHNATLRALADGVAVDVTWEDAQCAWQWGNSMSNQWHGVTHGARRLREYEDAHGVRFATVMRMRSDILFTAPFDFDAYARAMRACAPRGGRADGAEEDGRAEWVVLGDCLSGLDMVVVGTAGLMKRFLGEDVRADEGAFNLFVVRRAERLGAAYRDARACRPFGDECQNGHPSAMSIEAARLPSNVKSNG